jgi:hypothetical protein
VAQWTKKAAVDRVNDDPLVQEAMCLEPRLVAVIKEAMHQKRTRGYNRIQKYIELKNRATALVGQFAEVEQLRTQEYYDAVRGAIDDLLPPDHTDLFADQEA